MYVHADVSEQALYIMYINIPTPYMLQYIVALSPGPVVAFPCNIEQLGVDEARYMYTIGCMWTSEYIIHVHLAYAALVQPQDGH